MFTLCPRLQSLTLSNLAHYIARKLPRDATPHSLRELHLSGHAPSDIIPLYLAWRSDALRETSLSMRGPLPADFAPLFTGVVALALDIHGYQTSLSGRDAEGRTLLLNLLNDSPALPTTMERLLLERTPLHGVRTLRISSRALELFIDPISLSCELEHGANAASLFPELKDVTVFVVRDTPDSDLESDDEDVYRAPAHEHSLSQAWEQLRCLAPFLGACTPTLALAVDVFCPDPVCPPDAEDALALSGVLAAQGDRLPPVLVRGFTEAATREVHVDGITFDCNAAVEPVHIWSRKKCPYYRGDFYNNMVYQ
ncbi:hypothetical protein AURDEDRAFT_110203 [Auricularia subglabra TFB-10046 SS5]|nr:hypothetical protein AURDEDRAFT_110203 [Auricularia subglabra TFB-10046 SS5]